MKNRVVIVDDEPITRMDLADMLAEIGYQVVGEAGDGFDAVEVCRAQRPDMVLLDVRMPVFDGFGAAETIIKEETAGCVVFLTAYNDRESIERAKEIGVAGYLVKPVEQRLLLPTLEVALAQSERLRQSREETARSRQELTESRLIQRAQSVLARRENVSETVAYQILRRLSMEKRTSMATLAKALLEQEEQQNVLSRAKWKLMREQQLTEEDAYRRLVQLAKAAHCTKEEMAEKLCCKTEVRHG